MYCAMDFYPIKTEIYVTLMYHISALFLQFLHKMAIVGTNASMNIVHLLDIYARENLLESVFTKNLINILP